GDHALAERVGHDDDGLDERRGCRVLRDLLEERPIDLHGIDRILPQVVERGITGTEIVEREVYTELRKPRERRAGGLVGENAFGKLELEQARVDAVLVECL